MLNNSSAYAMPGLKYHASLLTKEQLLNLVIENTCAEFGITQKVLKTICRKRNLVEARQIIMFILWETRNYTLTSIGKIFNRDHTTVIHSKDNIIDLMEFNELIRLRVARIKRNCGL